LKATTFIAFDVVACRRRWRQTTLLIAAVSVAPWALRAQTESKNHPPSAEAKSATHHTSHKPQNSASIPHAKTAPSGHTPSKTKSTKHTGTSQSRDARRRSAMRPEPQRVQEIQEALVKSGELHQEPTGQWDEATREAMKRYQQANGFGVTGLPDSKSLMKMGLGPHPLPPNVATPAAARASLDPTVNPAPLAEPNANPTPAAVDPPQEHR